MDMQQLPVELPPVAYAPKGRVRPEPVVLPAPTISQEPSLSEGVLALAGPANFYLGGSA